MQLIASRAAHTAVWCALAMMFAHRISVRVVDLDLYHQLALAREVLSTGAFPARDPFAFTPTHAPVIHHEWGAGMIAYAIASAFGANGILALRYLLAAALAVVALRASLRRDEARPVVWALAPLALLLADYGFSPVRAQSYSFLLAAATLWCLELDRDGRRRWMPAYAVMFAAWVNLHGGFVVGVAFLAAHAVEQWARGRPFLHLAGFTALLGLLVAVNPWGISYYGYLARALTMPRRAVAEWLPLWADAVPVHHKAVFVLSVALVLFGLARRRTWRVDGAAVLLVSAALAVRHHRMLPFFAIAFLVYAPRLLARTELGTAIASLPRSFGRPLAVGATAIAIALGALLHGNEAWNLSVPNAPSAGSPMSFPVGAANFLRTARFRGNVLTPFEQGAFLSWKLYPDVKVSLDSRYEAAYPDWLVDELLAFYGGQVEPQRVLERHAPDLLLIPAGAPVRSRAIPWRVVYEDPGFALYARPGLQLNVPANVMPLIDSFP
jgi:hypothetical protein